MLGSGILGGVDLAQSCYQQALEGAARQRSASGLGSLLGSLGLTRFDPSTKTRVPVTQEWVDEAVAEIVRLNQEIECRVASRICVSAWGSSHLLEDMAAGASKVDHIWEAVRAASAV